MQGIKDAQSSLLTAELSLRLAKGGSVGIDCVHFMRPEFVGFTGEFTLNFSEFFIPRGTYELNDAEVIDVQKAWKSLNGEMVVGQLQTAIERLSLAETRTDFKDKIVDACIGLEALLLRTDVQGELSYQFAINYSVLDPKRENRLARYDVARDIYKLRSKVAHGAASMERTDKQGRDIPDLSCVVLREVIHYFLNTQWPPPADFWLKKVLVETPADSIAPVSRG